MLSKDLLVTKKRKPNIYPKYADLEKDRHLADKIIKVFENHIGKRYFELNETLEEFEDFSNFKMVRGLSKLLERRCRFEEISVIEPRKLRSFLFEKGFVTSEKERISVLKKAETSFNISIDELEFSLWADLEEYQVIKSFDSLSAPELLRWYNLSLTQTLLFDAIELNFKVSGNDRNYQEIFKHINFLGLMYEVIEERDCFEIFVNGPASLLRKTKKYGVSLAKLIPVIMRADRWEINAKIETTVGNEPRIYNFSLDDLEARELILIKKEEECEKFEKFDSSVEMSFARRFRTLKKDWELKREPTLLKSGTYVFIPDFCFEKRGMKQYLEVVGFWTDEYLEKKILKIRKIDVPMIIAVDKALKCTKEAFEGGGQDKDKSKYVIFYEKNIPIKPIIKRLDELEYNLKEIEVKKLRDKDIEISGDVISFKDIAERHEVGVEAVEEFVSRKLEKDKNYVVIGERIASRKALQELKKRIESLESLKNNSYQTVLKILDEFNLGPKALNEIGYKVEWSSLDPESSRVVKIEG